MTRPRLLVLLVALAIVAVLAWRAMGGREVDAVAATRGPITQTVIATGRVSTLVRVEVGSVITGTVAALLAREGERVKAGQLLARLDDREASAARAQARAALAESQARLTQLARLSAPVAEENVQQARAQLALAQAEYERTAKLQREGFFSKSKLDEARRTLDVATSALQAAGSQAASNQPGGSDVQLAIARREQAQAALAAAEVKLDNTRIRAPAAGVLLARGVEAGDVVQPGRRLFLLAADGETQLVANVDEKNLRLVREGLQAMAAADAYPGSPFPATVFYIGPGVDAQRGTVEVKLRAPQPPDFLKSDMTLSVEIEAARKPDALLVPSGLVRDATSPAPWALVARDGRALRVALKLGLRGSGTTEVLEGLAAGDALLAPESGVTDGQRVRARLRAAPAAASKGPAPAAASKGPATNASSGKG